MENSRGVKFCSKKSQNLKLKGKELVVTCISNRDEKSLGY